MTICSWRKKGESLLATQLKVLLDFGLTTMFIDRGRFNKRERRFCVFNCLASVGSVRVVSRRGQGRGGLRKACTCLPKCQGLRISPEPLRYLGWAVENQVILNWWFGLVVWSWI